jgi:hypothetical protein
VATTALQKAEWKLTYGGADRLAGQLTLPQQRAVDEAIRQAKKKAVYGSVEVKAGDDSGEAFATRWADRDPGD